MANFSLTYPFLNGQIAAGFELSKNFQDIVNGLTNGTKDISIGKLTTTGIVGITDGSSAAAGNVGQIISSSITSLGNFPTSGQFGDVTSLDLTPGQWEMFLHSQFAPNGSTCTSWSVGIGTSSGNTSAGLSGATNFTTRGTETGATALGSDGVDIVFGVNITSNTTYYFKCSATYSLGTPQVRGTIRAIRASR